MTQCLQTKQVICLETDKYIILLNDYKKVMNLFSSHHECLPSFINKLKNMNIYIEQFQGK